MKIGCLAWGSLLWKTGPLKLASSWHDDGPMLPIEFARVADAGELSTTLCEGMAPQRTWWVLLQDEDLAEARESLRQREQVDVEHPEWIGSLPASRSFFCSEQIGQWLKRQDLDAVVWTALPPRFDGVEGQPPSVDQAVDYLEQLQGEVRAHAESYVRQIPSSLATGFRKAIEMRLGWIPTDLTGSS